MRKKRRLIGLEAHDFPVDLGIEKVNKPMKIL